MSTNLRNPADRRDYPARWTMRRGKELFREIDERSADGSEELLSVSHITGITPRSQKNVTMFQSESLVGYKICRPGDIAANTMWTWQGAIGVSDYFGVISPSYNVYRQRQDTYNPRYLDFLLREPKLVDVYYSLSTGIRPSRRRLYPDEFLTIRFPVPPRAEQDKIVRFLDEKANAIDEVIATRQKQIDELHELRKTIINRAVTRGISRAEGAEREGACPHAPSNARRLGTAALPNGWKAVRMREAFTFRKGLSITKANLEETGIPVVSYGQIHSKDNSGTTLLDSFFRFVNESYLKTDKSAVVQSGDFIFADTSEDVPGCGNCVYVDRDDVIFAGYHTIIAHPVDKPRNKYLAYYFQSQLWRDQVWKTVCAVKVYSITQRLLRDTLIVLPRAAEQREIAAYLDEKCATIDKAIENRKAAIEELVALKARIVADAVTGRMEVE